MAWFFKVSSDLSENVCWTSRLAFTQCILLQANIAATPRIQSMFSHGKSTDVSPCRSPAGLRLYLSHRQPSQLQLLLALSQAQWDGSGRGGRGGRGLRPAPSSPASTLPHRVYAAGQSAPLSHLLQYQRLQTQPDHAAVLAQRTIRVLRTLGPERRNTLSVQGWRRWVRIKIFFIPFLILFRNRNRNVTTKFTSFVEFRLC